jgi:hypothetical protein
VLLSLVVAVVTCNATSTCGSCQGCKVTQKGYLKLKADTTDCWSTSTEECCSGVKNPPTMWCGANRGDGWCHTHVDCDEQAWDYRPPPSDDKAKCCGSSWELPLEISEIGGGCHLPSSPRTSVVISMLGRK